MDRKDTVDLIIDSDAYNEIDDQFAVAYALCSGTALHIVGLHAAPFKNHRVESRRHGMEMSFQELAKVNALCNRSAVVRRGSTRKFSRENPEESEAVKGMIEAALQHSPEAPLSVAAIGGLTNIASALALAPEIASALRIVWLGSNLPMLSDRDEFNLQQDLDAAGFVCQSEADVTVIPCKGCASHLWISQPELEKYFKPDDAVCQYLYALFRRETEGADYPARILWDLAPIAFFKHPDWFCTAETVLSQIPGNPVLSCATYLDRGAVFHDFFKTLTIQSQ